MKKINTVIYLESGIILKNTVICTTVSGSVVHFYNAFIVTFSKLLSVDIFRGILQDELAVLFPQRMK